MMDMEQLCIHLDCIKNGKTHQDKQVQARQLMNVIRQEQPNRTFTIMRLILPKLDMERQAYRIKESKISKLLIRMLDLPQGSSDRNVLSKSEIVTSTDFAEVIYSVLRKYIVNQETTVDFENLNEYLDRIANRTTDTGLDDLLLEIFKKLSSLTSKWFIRMILKNLKLGLSDNSMLNCYHADAVDYYSANSNLRKLCETFYKPDTKLHELEIKLFEPFRPMLSKRCDGGNFKKCFPENKTFIIENKFDGERFQFHFSKIQIKLFSRNGYDFTDSLRDNFLNDLVDYFPADADNFILDGELMLYNTQTKTFGSKGLNLDVKKLTRGKYKPCYCVFDILLYNNRILTSETLFHRLQILKTVVHKEIPGTISLSQYTKSKSPEEIVAALNNSVDNNEEGIVVKNPSAIYKCGDRNAGWFKVKMEYFDDVVHDLDLLLMGGFYGANKKINSFMVGVASGGEFLSMGRIGSGLNAEQLDLLNDKLKNCGKEIKNFTVGSRLQFGRELPDVFIEPEQSCVLQIRATELTRSTTDFIKTPYTLRFPRVLKIREDKRAEECLSMNELLELTAQNKAVIKLNKRHIDLSEIASKNKRPAKQVKLEIVNKIQATNITGNVLQGQSFFVQSASKDWPIEEVYDSIKKAGGQVVYKLSQDVDVVLVAQMDKNVHSIIRKTHPFDVVSVDWLSTVFQKGQLVDYESHLISRGVSFKRQLGDDLDMFGDSFCKSTSREELDRILCLMSKRGDFLNTN